LPKAQELFPLSATIFFWQKKPEKGFSLQSGLGFGGIQEIQERILFTKKPLFDQ